MLTGGFDLAFPGRRFGCAPGSVFVEPAGERHSNRMAPHGAEVLAVQPAPGTAGEPAWAGFFARVSYRRHGRIAALATRVVTEVRRPDPFSALAAQALVVDMLVAALRGESKLAAHRPPSPEVLGLRELLHEGSVEELRIPARSPRGWGCRRTGSAGSSGSATVRRSRRMPGECAWSAPRGCW